MQSALADAAPQDRDILELLRRGERDRAFTQLLDRYEHKLYRLCCTLLRDTTSAQDAAQESWVRIWKALSGYDGRASLSTWMYAITRNRCLTALARQREQMTMFEPESEADQVSAETEELDEPTLLRELIERLPERYRRVLTLYYYEERSVGDVAAMLGLPDSNVKTMLHRARAALMEQLRRRGLDAPSIWLETYK